MSQIGHLLSPFADVASAVSPNEAHRWKNCLYFKNFKRRNSCMF